VRYLFIVHKGWLESHGPDNNTLTALTLASVWALFVVLVAAGRNFSCVRGSAVK
jgi:hypothetical protein